MFTLFSFFHITSFSSLRFMYIFNDVLLTTEPIFVEFVRSFLLFHNGIKLVFDNNWTSRQRSSNIGRVVFVKQKSLLMNDGAVIVIFCS